MLKQLTTHHREIARLKFEGCKPTEIAKRMNIPISTVRTTLNDPLCKAHIANLNLRADSSVIAIRKRLAELTIKAVDRIDEILDPASENVPWSVISNTAKDVLDRSGHAPAQQINHNHVHITAEDIQRLKERAVANGAVIEAR